MNNERRKLKRHAIERLQEALEILTIISEEEEECYYNLPESIQDSERGQQISDNIDQLQEYVSMLEDAIEELEVM